MAACHIPKAVAVRNVLKEEGACYQFSYEMAERLWCELSSKSHFSLKRDRWYVEMKKSCCWGRIFSGFGRGEKMRSV